MATLMGRIHFPGLDTTFLSATYTVAHGVTPGAVIVRVAASGFEEVQVPFVESFGLPFVDDLIFTDGQREFTLKGCRVDSMQRVREGDGVAYEVTVYDRRWKWKLATVSGANNVRDPLGKIKPFTKATVKEMAQYLLRAMGEKEGSWDVSALPVIEFQDTLPEAVWEYANAAEALAELCDRFNCRVVYQPIKDRVLIAKAGVGAELPKEPYADKAFSRAAPPKPEILRFVGAPAVFLVPLVLEAVGEDFDGSVVPIDELSYKPEDGWGRCIPPYFHGVQPAARDAARGRTREDAQALAKKSIYRWYRITNQPANGETFLIPGLTAFKDEAGQPIVIEDADQLVPYDRIFGTSRDEKRQLYVSTPQVYGIHWRGKDPQNTESDKPVTTGFSVDPERRLVVFSAHIHRVNLTAARLLSTFATGVDLLPKRFGPAELVILTSVSVLDPTSYTPLRYTRDRKIEGGVKGLVQVIRREDVQFAEWTEFQFGDWKTKQQKNNKEEVEKAADHYLDGADDFAHRRAEAKTYPQLLLQDPDGAIQSVTWNCAGTVSTNVSRNNENVKWLPPYRFRRGQERAKTLLEVSLAATKAALAIANTPNG